MGNAINQLLQLVIPTIIGLVGLLSIYITIDRLITKKNDNGGKQNNS